VKPTEEARSRREEAEEEEGRIIERKTITV
jgi:hypothetical protein